MDVGRETATARVVTLMTPGEKSNLEAKARKAGLSVGEIVRRSVEAYDPEEMRQLEELAVLAREFRASAERASRAVDRTNASIEKTLEELAERRRT
ncbi:hypothetical protein [Kumtagia ephedrae]|uniref:Ribbon-helix-helix protein CopG domain-containing protein n=1 Tax=Kumtagia ephedrae TaxID=2116701 RepID=A0A2P7SJ54_9HYPH|nr:hypothetical protein [Mesorhizobium ephedrae]PSJ62529.1 hypothetical protein C7I84_07935 [Mesorhizobium ephedrae]